MEPRKKKKDIDERVAPGIDPDEAFGEEATPSEMKEGESTTVTRLSYDEYDPSDG